MDNGLQATLPSGIKCGREHTVPQHRNEYIEQYMQEDP